MIPQLRFKVFNDNWQTKKLEEIAYYSSDRIEVADLSSANYVGVDSLFPGLRGKSNSQFTPEKGKVVKYIKGDILHSNIRPYLRKAWLANEIGGASADVLVIRTNDISTDNKYIYYRITSDDYFDYVMAGVKGVKMPRGDKAHIMNYSITLPSLFEQQKIAVFLTIVDGRIDKIEKKLELLHHYKKSVMQKIFTQQIRFKDEYGNNYSDWNEKRFGELGKFYRGLTYSAVNVKSKGSLVLRSSNIQKGALVLDKDLQFVDKTYSNDIALIKNDIVICMANGSRSLVGKIGVYDGSYDGNLTVGAFCSIFRGLSPLSRYLFQTYRYNKYLDTLLAGTNINNLKNSDLEELRFMLPKSKDEEQKIATFLTALDDKIKAEKTKLVTSKRWKKGLLQRMFA